MNSLEELLESQRATFSLIQRIIPNYNKLAKAKRTATAVKTRLACLQSYWDNCQQLHARICALAGEEARKTNSYFLKDTFMTISDSVEEIRDYLSEAQESLQPRETARQTDDSHGSRASTQSVLKLPRINIPKFSGELINWETFRDIFESLVATNAELSNVQKLHYLKASLSGEASLILSNLHVTDANYQTAWDLLKKRYDNPRAIVNAHLQTFLDIPCVSSHSVNSLKNLRDQTSDCYTALLNLKRPVNLWEDLLIFITVSKLDKLTRRDWELSLGENVNIPNFAELDGFLTARIRALEAVQSSVASTSKYENSKPSKLRVVRAHQTSSGDGSCCACGGDHATHRCKTFLNLTVEQRVELLKNQKCCFNCLRKGHLPWSCKSNNLCAICKRKHHSLIHREKIDIRNPTASLNVSEARSAIPVGANDNNQRINAEISSNSFVSRSVNTALLPTATVLLRGNSGNSIRVRALLDQGSQASFVSESVVRLLKAERENVSVDVTGIGGTPSGKVKHIASLTLEPCSMEGPVFPITALVLHKLTEYLPPPVELGQNAGWLKSLKLADAISDNRRSVELIIGADYYGSILREGVIHESGSGLTAQLTIFGWVVSGPTPRSSSRGSDVRLSINHAAACDPLHESLSRFWELEQVPCSPSLSDEELRCEKHFLDTHSRQVDGRYIVRLPFKSPAPPSIGETESDARRIFFFNEARLRKQPDIEIAYRVFMAEYQELKHMEKVPRSELTNGRAVYLPHHAAIKTSDSSKQVRVVFNASRASSNRSSLNDHLMIGPKLQGDLFALLLKWRTYKFVITTDITKMFRQIRIHSADVDFQRIFWRNDPDEQLSVFRLLTVTYGTASAPYLANRVLKQLAKDEGERFPLASPILTNNVYVDDVMFGAEDVVLLRQAQKQLVGLLMAGGFRTHKWISNEPSLLRDVPESDRCVLNERPIGDEASFKVLGISWNPTTDVFSIQIRLDSVESYTKRSFLSLLARVFDPLGWVAPVTINAKITIQILWLSKVGWDDPLPADLSQRCLAYQQQLIELNKLVFPRWTGQSSENSHLEIHGFADASNVAYAAAIYLRVESLSQPVKVSLLYSKTRVAPLKVQSIPRLELCAAVLLTRSVEYVQHSMELGHVPVYCWSDSTVTLAWLRAIPSRWATFVANRVSSIVTALPNATWRYVASRDNPADCATRGITAQELINHSLWWRGPPWLESSHSEWPVTEINSETELEKRREAHAHVTLPLNSWNLPEEFSSWSRLLRVTAYVRRFIFNIRNSKARITHRYVTAEEIHESKVFWFKVVQSHYFSAGLSELRSTGVIVKRRELSALNPFVDANGILRVGGRIRRAELSEDEKFPVILPKCRVAELIIRYMHSRSLHGGLQSTLRLLRQSCWILGARGQVKFCIRNCVICARQRASTVKQRMGELPSVRVKPARPFANTGVDYAGPFNVRTAKGRGHKTQKAYLVLLVCLSTRAIHLEVASDFTTNGFLAAFERFSARRGLPANVYSDNGTNFVGANIELSRRIRNILRDADLRNFMSTEEIKWHFIPPAAPHFGGLWEAGVKSVKHHLRRILGDFTPTYEEFSTLLCKIECILNSRPIAPLNDDVDNYDALTPGHFLVGSHLRAVPDTSVWDINIGRLSRWQAIQQMQEQFWKVWSSDYLNALQQRTKWQAKHDNLRVGDMVIIKHPNLPPTKWDLGRVSLCHPGEDGLVRVVTVKTMRSVLKRPVTQLCKLPVNETAN